MPALHPGRT